LLHIQGTNQWLRVMGALPDLRSQAAILAQQAARDRDTPTAMGIATVGSVGVILTAGAFDLAQVVRARQRRFVRMAGSLEVGDHKRAVAIAEGLRPEVHSNRPRQAAYWLDYRPCAAPGVASPAVCSPRPAPHGPDVDVHGMRPALGGDGDQTPPVPRGFAPHTAAAYNCPPGHPAHRAHPRSARSTPSPPGPRCTPRASST